MAQISKKEAFEDLSFVSTKLRAIHPNPFFDLQEDRFNLMLNQVIDELNNKDGLIQCDEFYRLLNPVISSLNDAHTKLYIPYKNWKQVKVLPLNVDLKFDNNLTECSAIVNEVFRNHMHLKKGDEILSINGLAVVDILKKIAQNKYGKNYNMRLARIDFRYFPGDLYKVFGFRDKFNVTYRNSNGEVHDVLIKGIRNTSFVKRVYTPPFVDKNHLDTIYVSEKNGFLGALKNKNIAYLYYDQFGGHIDSVLFNKSFDKINTLGFDRLIIDLRHNWGGSTNSYQHILSYLMQDSVQVFSSLDYKFSCEFYERKFFGIDFTYPDDSDLGKIVRIDKKFLKEKLAAKSKFKGELYCLCDAGTFSTASSFCAIIKDYELGKLVGEATGGMASSYGNYIDVKLPNSELGFLISTGFYTRPNGDSGIKSVKPHLDYTFRSKSIRDIIVDISKL